MSAFCHLHWLPMMRDDDALFADVLALLASDATPSSDALPQPRLSASATKKPYAIGSAARRKIAIDALRVEEKQLVHQLTWLRARNLPFSWARERAAVERVQRQRAERECEMLREAVYQQTQFLRGLQRVRAVGPEVPLTLNLCHQLHTFTRLPQDPIVRLDEYDALTKDTRLRAAMELLCRETEHIAISDCSYIDAEYEHESDDACAVTTTSVFVLDDADVSSVLDATSVAVRDIVVRCRVYQCVGVSGAVVDEPAFRDRHLQYRVTNIRRMSAYDGDDFSVESLAMTMTKMIDGAGVVLWDFVDVDERYPLEETPDISRQSVGACLVRREQCPDGIERTVLRALSTRRYEFRGSGAMSASVCRYFESLRYSMRSNELLFRDIMTEQMR